METLQNIGYLLMTAAIMCAGWIVVGFVAKFVVFLFCIGYGCA